MSQRWNTNERSENPWAGGEKGLNSTPGLPVRNYATSGIHFTCLNLPSSDLWSAWVGQERLAVVLSSLVFWHLVRQDGGRCQKILMEEGRLGLEGLLCRSWGTVRLNRCTLPGTHGVYLFFGYIYSCSPAPSCHFILGLKMFQTPKLKIGKRIDSNMWPVEAFLILRFPFFTTLEK